MAASIPSSSISDLTSERLLSTFPRRCNRTPSLKVDYESAYWNPLWGQSQEEMYKQNDKPVIEPITYTAERRNNVSFIWKHAWSYPNLFSVIKEHQQGLKTF